MRIVYFTHSLRSCWNHGNAHFLRGVLRELIALGHEVRAYEPDMPWSLENLLKDHGPAALASFREFYPDLEARTYDEKRADLEELTDGADLVVVHEWNEPDLVADLGRLRARGAAFTLLFHDTHHRAVSAPEEMRDYDLDAYDGVLAFGEALAEVYRRWGWRDQVFVWHEAADTRRFRPPPDEDRERSGLAWIGNWGDGERTAELEEFLLEPAGEAGLRLDIHGVRYPREALRMLSRYGAAYRGWLPNSMAPEAFASRIATVHVPRRFYTRALPGIPTIRVFEALACGIPLVCAPWEDAEHLFRPGEDYLLAANGADMKAKLTALREDAEMRAVMAANGLGTIESAHTCAHRADELLAIHARLTNEPLRNVA